MQIKEAGGALDVGSGCGRLGLQLHKGLAAAEQPCELAHELVKMVLHYAVEINQVAVDVVEHFAAGGGVAQEKQGCAACEQLYITAMLGKQRQQVFG